MAASTQNQAKSALLFLYQEVLGVELPWLDDITQAKTPKRLPVVLTRDEAARALGRVAFAFDPARDAILLTAGDKAGADQKRFYKSFIAVADGRFDEHVQSLRPKLRRT